MKLLCRFLPAVLLLVFAVLLFPQQPQREVPTCHGAECHDEVTDTDHPDWPAWCQNESADGYKANCHCQRESCSNDSRSANCARYCTHKGCRCNHGCVKTQ